MERFHYTGLSLYFCGFSHTTSAIMSVDTSVLEFVSISSRGKNLQNFCIFAPSLVEYKRNFVFRWLQSKYLERDHNLRKSLRSNLHS